jgi:hypothetical protein
MSFFRKIAATISNFALLTFINSTAVLAQNDGVFEEDVVSFKWLEILFQNLIGIFLRLIGIVAFIMLIIGGFKMMASGGDPESIASARSKITQALVGLVVAILAWFVLLFIGNITGIDLTKFSIEIQN